MKVKQETQIAKKEIKAWGTFYHTPILNFDKNGIDVRDINGRPLGVKLSESDICSAAMEGTFSFDSKIYTYSGETNEHVFNCRHKNSGHVKFKLSSSTYGEGSRGNELIPYYSLACDNSVFPFGSILFIKDAVGTVLRNGKAHGGFFRCDDVGGLIKGNHLDFYIGFDKINPFEFVRSKEEYTFTVTY